MNFGKVKCTVFINCCKSPVFNGFKVLWGGVNLNMQSLIYILLCLSVCVFALKRIVCIACHRANVNVC